MYALARHPIDGGVLLIALGGSLISSLAALIPAALLGRLFQGKRRREEAWLFEQYPEYPSPKLGPAGFPALPVESSPGSVDSCS